jgi:electron transfer flavoprotein alpha subunit
MSRVLVIGEHDGITLSSSTAKAVSCAATIPDSAIDVVVFSNDGAGIAEQAAKIDGVSQVLVAEHDSFEHPVAAAIAPQVVAMSSDYTHVFGSSSTFGKDLMPRVAALLDVNQVSDVMSIDGSHSFRRPIYAGNAIVSVNVPSGDTVVATVRTASFKAAGSGNSAPIDDVELVVEIPTHTRFVSLQAGSSDRPDLQTAPTVVSGGRGIGSAENFQVIYSLADKLGAAVGASRAAVDAGYVPNEMQVGQTGKIIAPDLYIAVGISGAIQHLTGIKDAGTIVAINKDAEAPIFEVADIGLVGDLFEVLPALHEQLS